MIFVIGENSFFGTPTAAYCNAVRTQAGLDIPGVDVVYDTQDLHKAYGGRDASLILSDDGTIVFKSSYPSSHPATWAAMQAELDAPP